MVGIHINEKTGSIEKTRRIDGGHMQTTREYHILVAVKRYGKVMLPIH
jgi:hypothetical protein